MTFDIIKTRGSHYEMGIQQGRFAHLYAGRRNLEATFRELKLVQDTTPVKGPAFNFVFSQIAKVGGKKILESIQKEYPNQYERLEGIAEGYGISNEVLAGGIFMENFSGDCRSDMKIPPHACTAGVILNENGAFMIKNFDFPFELEEYQIVRYSDNAPGCGYKSIGLSLLPLVGVISGINEYGVAITMNSGYSLDIKMRNPPMSLIIQDVLEHSKTSDEAIELIKHAPVCAGWILTIADKDTCGIVERTPTSFGVRDYQVINHSKYIATGNTFYHQDVVKNQLPYGTKWTTKNINGRLVLEPSNRRKEQMDQKLIETAKSNNLTIETLRKVLASHNSDEPNGGDTTICRHGEYYKTLSSVIIDLKTKDLYYIDGCPCTTNPTIKFPFSFDYEVPRMRFTKKQIETKEEPTDMMLPPYI